MGHAMAATEPHRGFHVTRDMLFWILAAVAMIALGVVLDIVWGNL